MMAKMSKPEIYAKILKRRKSKFFIRITPKAFQLTARVRSLSSSVRHRILAAILYFDEETEKREKKNYQANSLRPVCILQIFGNNPSKGFRVGAERSGGGGGRTQQKQ